MRNIEYKYDAHVLSKVFNAVITPDVAAEFGTRSVIAFMVVCGALVTKKRGQDALLTAFRE